MRTSALYSTSQILRDAVHDTTKRIIAAIERPIQLVEYITLPDFGQRIVLRFKLVEGLFASAEEADTLASRMRALAGSGLLGDVGRLRPRSRRRQPDSTLDRDRPGNPNEHSALPANTTLRKDYDRMPTLFDTR